MENEHNKTVYDDNKKIEYSVLEKEIKKLRPLSVFSNEAWILTYMPTKEKITKDDIVTSTYNNYPYFITSNKKMWNLVAERIPGFQTTDLVIGEQVRWNVKDVFAYLNDKNKVDLKVVFESIHSRIGDMIELKTPDYLNVCVLWTIGTYFYRLFEYFPYLDFSGSKGSGKTKGLTVLECLCYNAQLSHKLTGPAWARIVESLNCTLLVDEQEDLQSPKEEHWKNTLLLLNSAFRTSARQLMLLPSKNNQWKWKSFDIGVPVALGHITPLNEVTEDRTIPMRMIKGSNKKIVDTEVVVDDPIWAKLRDLLYRSFLDYFDEVMQIRKEIIGLDYISARERNQIWKPIIVLARMFERYGIIGLEKSVENVIGETHQIKNVGNQSRNKDVQVLEAICEAIVENKIKPIGEKEEYKNWYEQNNILILLTQHYDFKYLSAKEFGAILDRLQFVRKKKNPHNMCVFVTDEILIDLCKRYNLEYQALEAQLALSDLKNQAQNASNATSAQFLQNSTITVEEKTGGESDGS